MAREIDPSQPLTVGLWQGPAWDVPEQLNRTHRAALELSDVLSFHDYGNAGSMQKRIDQLKPAGRPLFCTEYMVRGNGSTFDEILPLLKSEGVGGYCWGLVDGKSQTKYPWSTWKEPIVGDPHPWHHDIFRRDGSSYLEGEVKTIRRLTGKANSDDGARLEAVPFTETRIVDQFWLPKLRTNRDVTVWYDFQKCEETGRIDNFAVAGKLKDGEFRGIRFDDSDVFKVIEGASYSLAVQGDAKLDAYLDDLIAKIAAAQESDGYLFTCRTINPDKLPSATGETRWSSLRGSHELYNVGHMYEAAVAHFRATGKRTLLDVAIKNADLVCEVFGPGKHQIQDVPGHQEVELALVKLFQVTDDAKYLDQAEFFLDQRGVDRGRELYGEYAQDHLPVNQQSEPVGHAVRAMYLYAAMADVAALKQRDDYLAALDRIWSRLLERKIYLTGGIGAEAGHEGFGPDYELPNATAYNETCAAIGLVLWAQRMFLLHDDAEFMDAAELVLYNGLLSGVAQQGDRFFYPNPLESFGGVERQPWFDCSCCPVNVVRLLPSVPGFVYATSKDAAYVNLFIASETELQVGNKTVRLTQATNYPWDGAIRIQVDPEQTGKFSLKIRIPGWARNNRPLASDLYRFADRRDDAYTIRVNGEAVEPDLQRGYATLNRTWQPGDVVSIELPMDVRRVEARPEVVADRGKFAIQRGPLVYCAEAVDNTPELLSTVMTPPLQYDVEFDPRKLGGVTTIRVAADNGNSLALIPYFAWANRGAAEMRVWFPTSQQAMRENRVGLPTDNDQAFDHVVVGERNSETAHNLQTERSFSGRSGANAWWRDARDGGWFAYDLKLAESGPAKIVITYWGSDAGGRVFDILVNDVKVGGEDLMQARPASSSPRSTRCRNR